jgi:hypothetical protein
MAAFTKIDSFTEKLAEKVFNLGSDTLTVALTNTAHTASWSQLSDLTQVSYANLSSRVITTTSSAQTSGTYKLVLADLILSATGSVGPFRYIYIYDDTATNDELIGYFDYGSAVTLTSGQSFTIDFDATTGILTLV